MKTVLHIEPNLDRVSPDLAKFRASVSHLSLEQKVFIVAIISQDIFLQNVGNWFKTKVYLMTISWPKGRRRKINFLVLLFLWDQCDQMLGIKVAQMSAKVAHKGNHRNIYSKSDIFESSPKCFQIVCILYVRKFAVKNFNKSPNLVTLSGTNNIPIGSAKHIPRYCKAYGHCKACL